MVRKPSIFGAAVCLALLVVTPVMAQVTGAVFTTSSGCAQVNGNIYANKTDVFISGGPTKPGPLQDGSYYVRVTEPNGTLLGTSVGASNPTPFVVVSGHPAACLELWLILVKASNNSTPGYDSTTNPGGEYKLWISTNSTFDNNLSKTDNFKVRNTCDPTVEGCTDPPPLPISIIGYKYYDADASGTLTLGDAPLPGWNISTVGNVSGNTCTINNGSYGFLVQKNTGSYTITEGMPAETNWIATGVAGSANVDTTGATGDLQGPIFFNTCLGAGGGLTLGFWSNKNGQLLENASDFTSLTALNLRRANGDARDFTDSLSQNKIDLNSWLLNANAVNMAYMLSAQLAAMELNVLHSNVASSAMVYAGAKPPACTTLSLAGDVQVNGFVSVANLITNANAALADVYKNTVVAGDARSCQEYLKNTLDSANNNKSFVQGTACQYTFAACTH